MLEPTLPLQTASRHQRQLFVMRLRCLLRTSEPVGSLSGGALESIGWWQRRCHHRIHSPHVCWFSELVLLWIKMICTCLAAVKTFHGCVYCWEKLVSVNWGGKAGSGSVIKIDPVGGAKCDGAVSVQASACTRIYLESLDCYRGKSVIGSE